MIIWQSKTDTTESLNICFGDEKKATPDVEIVGTLSQGAWTGDIKVGGSSIISTAEDGKE